METTEGLRLDDLVESVERAGPNALERLAAAVDLAGRLGVMGDNLVGHFVDEAKAAGESWSRIGGVLGVSKQAAQQRFVPRGAATIEQFLQSPGIEHYTGRALHVLRQGEHHARRRAHPLVGTEHLLLGLLDEPEGLGCRAIETLGSTTAEVRQKLKRHLGATGADGGGTSPPTLTPRAEKALELALREALRLGHNYVGTEHLLLGLLLVPDGVACSVLAMVGVTHEATSPQVVRLLHAAQRRERATGAVRPNKDLGVVVVEADAFSKAEVASTALRRGEIVLLDLRAADVALRRRAVDIVSGAAHALGATVDKVGDAAVVLLPDGRKLENSQRQALEAFLDS